MVAMNTTGGMRVWVWWTQLQTQMSYAQWWGCLVDGMCVLTMENGPVVLEVCGSEI